MGTPALHRFLAKIQVSDGCWEWQGAKNPRGYSWFRGEGGTPTTGHRFAYEAFVGPVPEGLDLDHLCRNTSCVRPDHLEPVSHRENLLRGETIAACHAVRTSCGRGHEYPGIVSRRGDGSRICKVCVSDQNRVAYLKRKEKV